jgi:conjugal transfer/entry exclusion protein
MKKMILTCVALILVAALPLSSPGSGIPVIDFSNLTQNVVTALHQVSAYAQQVQHAQICGDARPMQMTRSLSLAPCVG